MWKSWVRQAWYLGGGLKPDEMEELTLSDRKDFLDALEWWLGEVEAANAGGTSQRERRES